MICAPASIARGIKVRAIVCFDAAPGGVVPEHPGELDRSPSELCRATLEHRRRRRWRAGQLRDRELGLDRVRVPVEHLGRELGDAVRPAPLVGELGREPVVEAAVDLGAPTDASALGVRDPGRAERGRRTLVAVLQDHLVERERLDRVGIDPRSFFDDDDGTAGAGERRGGDRATGAGADDEDLGLELSS